MSRYKTFVNIGAKEIHINGVFFGIDERNTGCLEKYARYLEGKSPRNENFQIGELHGVSFKFFDSTRNRFVLYVSRRLGSFSSILASAHADSPEKSEEMLQEFTETTGLKEVDVPFDIWDFYKKLEIVTAKIKAIKEINIGGQGYA